MEFTRETLRFEALAASGEEQIIIEGEAALPGSMRDAVTVLSVQAQANLMDMQSGMGEAVVRGRVRFQVLYTQGDLTRIRSLDTTCDFERAIRLPGILPGMRLEADCVVEETSGSAASGRITLRALLDVALSAFEQQERELITGAPEDRNLRTKAQSIAFLTRERIGEEKTLVREETELPARLAVRDVLSATATVSPGEIAGGSGRIGVTGTLTVRVLHQSSENGSPMVTTTHEVPYEVIFSGQLPEGAEVFAEAEVTDVMADSALSDKRRILRFEAEVRVRLMQQRRREAQLLTDLYTLTGPQLEPARVPVDLVTARETGSAQESLRLQVTLPRDVPPVETVLGAFVQPVLSGVAPVGRRLDAEGLVGITLIYLPQDSDIPYAVHVREPFAMTFPVEMGEGVSARLYAVETTASQITSERVEVRCQMSLCALRRVTQRVTGIGEVEEREEIPAERGFVLVWPADGESRWDTARRLRVAEEALRPAGKRALLAFRR